MQKICPNEIKQLQNFFEDNGNDLPEKVREVGLRLIKAYGMVYDLAGDLKRRNADVLISLRLAMGLTPSKESPPSDQRRGLGESTITLSPRKLKWWT